MKNNDGRSFASECHERYIKATSKSGQWLNFGGRSFSRTTDIKNPKRK